MIPGSSVVFVKKIWILKKTQTQIKPDLAIELKESIYTVSTKVYIIEINGSTSSAICAKVKYWV